MGTTFCSGSEAFDPPIYSIVIEQLSNAERQSSIIRSVLDKKVFHKVPRIRDENPPPILPKQEISDKSKDES